MAQEPKQSKMNGEPSTASTKKMSRHTMTRTTRPSRDHPPTGTPSCTGAAPRTPWIPRAARFVNRICSRDDVIRRGGGGGCGDGGGDGGGGGGGDGLGDGGGGGGGDA